MIQILKTGLFLLVLFAGIGVLHAQNAAIDSLNGRVKRLSELVELQNYERAQLEAEDFRWFLRREKLAPTVSALKSVSKIYEENKDPKSAYRFFEEMEGSVLFEKDIQKRIGLLQELSRIYVHWEKPDRADLLKSSAYALLDTIKVRNFNKEIGKTRHQLDSVITLHNAEKMARHEVIEVDRTRAYLFGAIALLAFLALLISNYFTAEKWKKRMANREMELQLTRSIQDDFAANAVESAPNPENPPAPMPIEIKTEGEFLPAAVAVREKGPTFPGPGEDGIRKSALIIEPNRQIVLYLKSLLSDQFDVETAMNANEGLQMVHDLLPDLVICDAVLNGKTGIDLVRQIKFTERTNHIPVILLTEKTGMDGKLDALRAGAESWFTRPLLDEELDAHVKVIFDERKRNQDAFSRYIQLYFTDSPISFENPFLTQTVHMIEQHLAEPDFTPEELARKLQLTKYQFFRKLKILSGKEPVQLIKEMRLEKAKTLLIKRAGTVQTIAELVGFPNPGSFTLSFKEYFGESTMLLNATNKSIQ